MLTPGDFIRLSLDPLRLAILGRAAEGRVDAGEIAKRMRVRRRDVIESIGKLRAAGLLTEDLTLARNALRELASELPHARGADPSITSGSWEREEADILSRFFAGERLTSIPASHAKRRVVLERLAQEFEPGLRYAEAEVNFTLQLFHADFASLRRYLVDEGFLTRAEGVYWRTGGRYAV
jgi:hypothetical protein